MPKNIKPPLKHPFTVLGKHKHPLDKIAECNGLLSGIALFPQVVKVAQSRDVEDLSVSTFVFIFINSVIWVLYARHRALPQLLLSSVLNCVAAGMILFFVFLFS